MSEQSDAAMMAAIGETCVAVLVGRPASDFMQSFPPVQLCMAIRELINTAQVVSSAQRTIDDASYHDNHTDAARARARLARALPELGMWLQEIDRLAPEATP